MQNTFLHQSGVSLIRGGFTAFACHNGHVRNGFAAVVVNDYLITVPVAVIPKGFREGSKSQWNVLPIIITIFRSLFFTSVLRGSAMHF